jgi:hypothetical protein
MEATTVNGTSPPGRITIRVAFPFKCTATITEAITITSTITSTTSIAAEEVQPVKSSAAGY